jgi:hypothetical protein
MLIHELLTLAGETTEVVEVGDGRLRELLRVPDNVKHRRYDDEGMAQADAGTVVVGLIGPDPNEQVEPAAVAPALRQLPVGGRAVLLLGWPIEELPYHVLLDSLVDAECQVLQVVPVDRANRHGVHCAVLAMRVQRLAPVRTPMDDTPLTAAHEEPGLRATLRLAAEYVFGDMVARPARRRLVEFRDKVAEQQQRIRQLERDLRARDEQLEAAARRLTGAREKLARVEASTTYQVGRTVVQGARRPGRAIISVPVGLVRLWRRREAVDDEQPGPTG